MVACSDGQKNATSSQYELIPPLTDDSYNESISDYSQDETDIDSSLDDTGTEFDEIVFRLNISHPDEIACEASRLVSARFAHITSESARIIHEILSLVWIGWDQLIELDDEVDPAENPYWEYSFLDDCTLYDLL